MASTATAPRTRQDLVLLNILATLPDNLPRVLAGLGFNRHRGPMERGGVPGFEPTYRRHRPWRARFAASDTVAGRGLAAGAWTPAAIKEADALDARDREVIAAANRAACRAPCRLLIRDAAPSIAVYVDATTGEWRDTTGGARGDDLPCLAAMMLGLPIDQAAEHIAGLCGLDGVPHA